jgi:hypothetical protein
MDPNSPTLGDSLQKVMNQWQQQYAQNDTANIPHDEVAAVYNQWTRQAPPDQQQAAIEHAFSQASLSQRSDIGSTLINLFMQNGLNPQAAGVSTTNPAQMSPQDLAQMTTYAQQQNPNIIRQLLSNPLVGMMISAALSYALQRFLGGTQGYNQPAPQQMPYGYGGQGYTQPQTGGGGLGDLLGRFLGGDQQAPAPTPQAPQQGGGLSDLFGQLFGGGGTASGQDVTSNPNYTPPGDNPLDVTHRR